MKRWSKVGAICIACCAMPVSWSAAADVKPIGAFPFALSGLSVDVGSEPRVLLWCQGPTLLGVVVPDDGKVECGASQKRVLPRAFLLRDGRCEADGSGVSFGFVVTRQAWLFGSDRHAPKARVALLLHRFEGSLKEGRLTGSLVQVDVSHPGDAFRKKGVDGALLPSAQPSFADEAAWRTGVAQMFCVATGGD